MNEIASARNAFAVLNEPWHSLFNAARRCFDESGLRVLAFEERRKQKQRCEGVYPPAQRCCVHEKSLLPESRARIRLLLRFSYVVHIVIARSPLRLVCHQMRR